MVNMNYGRMRIIAFQLKVVARCKIRKKNIKQKLGAAKI